MEYPYLLSTWVKAPRLKECRLAIVAACLPYINQDLFKEISEGWEVLLACPEREPQLHYGKIASIIRSTRPKEIHVYTIDGSPHCFTLHASVNEAEYILGEKLNKRHFVVVDGKELVEISPDAVRVARYLHIVDQLIKENPKALENLRKHSLEYRFLKEVIERRSRA